MHSAGERSRRPPRAPTRNLLPSARRTSRMGAKETFSVSFSLLFLLGFQPATGHPVNGLSPAKELASMEALLERLEEKFSLLEDLQQSESDFVEAETQRGEAAEFSDTRRTQPVETQMDVVPFDPDRTSLLKRMRSLQATRSMRDSGCFGRRLDRIGSVSGMGCRGLRKN